MSEFFKHEGIVCAKTERVKKTEKDTSEELTRSEYIKMLETAKAQGKMLPYLLIKIFAVTGTNLQDLPLLTVEALKRAESQYNRRTINQCVSCPKA